MTSPRYTVMAADRAGSWEVSETNDRAEALRVAQSTKAGNPRWFVGVCDSENDGRVIDPENEQ